MERGTMGLSSLDIGLDVPSAASGRRSVGTHGVSPEGHSWTEGPGPRRRTGLLASWRTCCELRAFPHPRIERQW